MLAFLRLLAVCVPVVFAIGAVYAALGQGMELEYVEPGVSRFPAPDDVFLMGSVLTLAFVTVWPPGRPRPRWLWGLLLLSLLGLVLSLVRGNWVAFAVAVVYLLLVLRVRERLRLIALGVVLVVFLAGGLAVAQPALLRSVVSRAMAVTAVQDRNVQWRLIENRAVGAQIEDSPWVRQRSGQGLPVRLVAVRRRPVSQVVHPQRLLLVRPPAGVVGMASVRVAGRRLPAPLDEGQGDLARDDPWLLGLVYGGRALLVALLVVSITSPRLSDKLAVTVLGARDGPLRGRAVAAQGGARRRERPRRRTQAVSAAASASG